MQFRNRLIRPAKVFALSAALVVFPSFAFAQDVPVAGLNPDSFYGKDSPSGVYVRDSAAALEKFALAQKMQGYKEWNKSADLYQEILEKYKDRVVPSQIDRNNYISQYTSVATAVQEQLCKWPPEGLAVYKARYEAAAEQMLKDAKRGDLQPLHEVYSRYFVTDAGKQAGLKLIDAYFEQGDFAAAAWIADKLLKWHPNLIVERPKVLYRAALAHHLCGDGVEAQDLLGQLKSKFADATGTVQGTDVNLAQSLEEALRTTSVIALSATGDDWRMIGGNDSRSKLTSARSQPGAKLFSLILSPPAYRANGQSNPTLENADKPLRDKGASLGVMPSVDRGELFYQDNARLYAVSVESGVPLPGWVATFGGRGTYTAGAAGTPPGEQESVTLTDKEVLAVMDQPDRLSGAGGQSKLVCLDRETGKEKFPPITAAALPDDASNLRALQLSGSPLVVGDNIYITGRGGKQMGFEDCYVLCFDLNSGKYRWSCYVASANSGNITFNPQTGQPVVNDVVSHLAYASGRLYVVTNLGAAAAIDAYSGTVVWLSIYRDPGEVPQNAGAMGMPFGGAGWGGGMAMPGGPAGAVTGAGATSPWTFSPPIVADGKLFCLPSDGKYIMVYDAGTGRVVKQIAKADFVDSKDDTTPSAPNTLIGVVGNRLIATSDDTVYCIDWKAYTPDHPRDSNDYWAELLTSQNAPSPSIRGRGFLTADSVFVPTAWALYQLDLLHGKGVTHRFDWSEGQTDGNVVVAEDHVVVAGDRQLDVYTDLDEAKRKLDAEISAAPADPNPRLRYAEVMFVANQTKLAMDKLDEAVKLLGGADAMRPGADRDHVFNDALTFAEKLGRVDDATTAAFATQLFDRAKSAAQTPAQQVAWRIARAPFDVRQENDFAGALALYQEILADPAMRAVTLPDEQSKDLSQAAMVAEKGIAQLLEKPEGIEAYAPFEKNAERGLAEAKAARSAAKMLAVALEFPNSKVAQDSMLAAADTFESSGDPRQATQVLRQIYLKYPNQQRERVLEAMARNYLLMPGRIDAAASRLAQAARLAPDGKLQKSLKLPDGSVIEGVTYAQARDAVSKYGGQLATSNLPNFDLPTPAEYRAYREKTHKVLDPLLPEAAGSAIANVNALVPAMQDFARPDRVVTWTGGAGVSIYAADQMQPVGVCADVHEAPRNVAWINSNALVWTDRQVTLMRGDSAKALWTLDLKQLPEVEVIAPPTPEESGATGGIGGGGAGAGAEVQIQIQGPMGRRMWRRRIMMQGGMVVNVQPAMLQQPPQPQGGEMVQALRPTADRLIVTTTTGRVLALDPATGKVVWQIRLSDHLLDRVVASDDFTVIRLQDQNSVQLIALDTFGGQLLARKAFPIDASNEYPINIALADDGMLVWTTMDRVCVHDLYEPGLEPRVSSAPSSDAVFMNMVAPDQLLVAGGQIFALSDNGRFVRVFSEETGQIRRYHPADSATEVDAVLKASASVNAQTHLRLSGAYLYCWGPRTVVAYDIDHPEVGWGTDAPRSNLELKDLMIGRDYLVFVDQPSEPLTDGNKSLPYCRLCGFSRSIVKGDGQPPSESGLWIYQREVSDSQGITTWQPISGGFVYLSGDGKLHTLRGAGAKTE